MNAEARNRRVTLAARPRGAPRPGDFALREEAVPESGADEMLLRTLYLSLDPYMRGRMNDAKSYAPAVTIGETMVGGTVSEVVTSTLAGFTPGDIVLGYSGWQDYAVSDGQGIRKIDPARAPVSTALGVLGMPGLTAYVGLLDIGQPQSGETVVVAAAAGAVGSLVGQIAKLRDCRAVGIAGSEEKCRHVVEELDFDACVSHRDPEFATQLSAACPDGIDVYFESVGGKVFEAAFGQLNVGARVPVCGMIAHYNDTELPAGPNTWPLIQRGILTRRLTLRGFIVFDHAHREPAFLDDMTRWLAEGRVRYREDIVDGLENAPEAFTGLLEGRNFGKLIVRVAQPSAT